MQHPPRTIVRLALTLSLAAGAVACSGDDDAGPLTAALDRIPLSTGTSDEGEPGGWDEVRFADFARAAEIAGLPAPGPDRTADELLELVVGITGARAEPGVPYVVVPFNLDNRVWLEPEAVRDETGLWLPAVETVTEAGGAPEGFTAITGEVSLGGSLVDDGDLLRAGEGDELDLDERSTLRPLGRPWFFAERDSLVALSFTRAPIDDWQAGGDTLAGDDAFAALAGALDEFDPYSAILRSGAFNYVPFPSLEADADAVADAIAADEALVPDVAPFTHVAIIEHLDDDDAPSTAVAYLFLDDDSAAAAVDPLTAAWLDLRTFGDTDDFSDLVTGVDATIDGRVLVLDLDATTGSITRRAGNLLNRLEPVFTYRLS